MTAKQRILVVVDPTTDAQPAFRRALWLAGKLGAELDLLICDYDAHLAGEAFFDTESLRKGRRNRLAVDQTRLRKLAAEAASRGVHAAIDARWVHPLHEGVLGKIRDSSPAFVVKDTHYHPLLKRSIFANTDWNLIRECPVPLLLVKPREIADSPVFVAAVDPLHERDKPAELDHDILALATRLSSAAAGELHVFHAFDPTSAFAVSSDSIAFPLSAPIDGLLDDLRAKHVEATTALVKSHGVAESRIHVLDGGARELLTALVGKLHADFVVMGAVSRNAVRRLFLGSSAEQIMNDLPCDLLIVKPAAAAAAV